MAGRIYKDKNLVSRFNKNSNITTKVKDIIYNVLKNPVKYQIILVIIIFMK